MVMFDVEESIAAGSLEDSVRLRQVAFCEEFEVDGGDVCGKDVVGERRDSVFCTGGHRGGDKVSDGRDGCCE